nr:MAG TPA: hypothetical protein [Caudoviricetes sp.]
MKRGRPTWPPWHPPHASRPQTSGQGSDLANADGITVLVLKNLELHGEGHQVLHVVDIKVAIGNNVTLASVDEADIAFILDDNKQSTMLSSRLRLRVRDAVNRRSISAKVTLNRRGIKLLKRNLKRIAHITNGRTQLLLLQRTLSTDVSATLSDLERVFAGCVSNIRPARQSRRLVRLVISHSRGLRVNRRSINLRSRHNQSLSIIHRHNNLTLPAPSSVQHNQSGLKHKTLHPDRQILILNRASRIRPVLTTPRPLHQLESLHKRLPARNTPAPRRILAQQLDNRPANPPRHVLSVQPRRERVNLKLQHVQSVIRTNELASRRRLHLHNHHIRDRVTFLNARPAGHAVRQVRLQPLGQERLNRHMLTEIQL